MSHGKKTKTKQNNNLKGNSLMCSCALKSAEFWIPNLPFSRRFNVENVAILQDIDASVETHACVH